VCLLAFAWQLHRHYPLVLAGNRDEFHDRPAAPMAWWEKPEGMLAGRDLRAGGSWLGVDRGGRFAVVTNFREPVSDTAGRSSRGGLVVDFLSSGGDTDGWIAGLVDRRAEYGGFNLIIGDGRELHYLTNRGDDRHRLPPGLYGLSNHRLDTPWPKVTAARDRMRRALDGDAVEPEALFGLLGDPSLAPDDELPDTGVPHEWERLLSAAFIVSPRYGTRASTVLLMDGNGRIEIEERSFDPAGDCVAEARFEFRAS
jgi:uncharacterized protein with NRDE domain